MAYVLDMNGGKLEGKNVIVNSSYDTASREIIDILVGKRGRVLGYAEGYTSSEIPYYSPIVSIKFSYNQFTKKELSVLKKHFYSNDDFENFTVWMYVKHLRRELIKFKKTKSVRKDGRVGIEILDGVM